MVDHVALRTESFAAHVTHILSYIFVASYVRRQILFILETFLAHCALGRTIVAVVLHVIIKIGLFAECLWTIWAPVAINHGQLNTYTFIFSRSRCGRYKFMTYANAGNPL